MTGRLTQVGRFTTLIVRSPPTPRAGPPSTGPAPLPCRRRSSARCRPGRSSRLSPERR